MHHEKGGLFMDRYQPYEKKGRCSMDPKPLPGRKVTPGSHLAEYFPVGSTSPCIYTVKISYDQFVACMNAGKYKDRDHFYYFIIQDEGVLNTKDDGMLRLQFLKYLQDVPYAIYNFQCSDSTLPAYIYFLNHMGWKKEKNTILQMTMDRHPATPKNIPIETAKGRIMIDEENLMWFPDQTLRLIKGKTNDTVLEDAFQLKYFARGLKIKLNEKYRFDQFTDFDKAFVAYHFLFDHPAFCHLALPPLGITYANCQTARDEHGVQILKPSETKWESRPVGTLKHNQGVCTGQSRLFNAVICSPEFQIPAAPIYGKIPSGESHCWSNFVIDNQIYQCCPTLRGLFPDLDAAGYKANDALYFPKIYPHASLKHHQIEDIRKHVKSLKR